MQLVGFKLHFTSHTSHQKILHHTTFHTTPPLHNIPHHINTYQFSTPHLTVDVATHLTSDRHILRQRSHDTAVCLGTTFHTTTSLSTTCSTSQQQSTSRTIPHPHHIHIQHHSIFHTTPYSTLHYTTRFRFYTTTSEITPLCIIFHIWHHTSDSHTARCVLHHHSSTPPHFTSHNFPHLALSSTFYIPGHHIPHHALFHITHFAFQSYHVWHCNIPHRTTFHIHWHRTTDHIAP